MNSTTNIKIQKKIPTTKLNVVAAAAAAAYLNYFIQKKQIGWSS